MSLGMILLIVLILLLIGTVPSYSYSRDWGYGPSGILGVLLIVLIILLLMGIIPIRVSRDGNILNVDVPDVVAPDVQIR